MRAPIGRRRFLGIAAATGLSAGLYESSAPEKTSARLRLRAPDPSRPLS